MSSLCKLNIHNDLGYLNEPLCCDGAPSALARVYVCIPDAGPWSARERGRST